MKDELYKMEKEKYEFIHLKELQYGSKSVRYSWIDDETIEFSKKFNNIMRKCNNFLDVGCGKGAFIEFFSKKYNKPLSSFLGVDISEAALSRCPKGIKTLNASMTDLPLENQSFDMVIHFDGMEHIPPEVEEEALNNIMRTSKKYVALMICTKSSREDPIMRENGYSDLHVNIKTFGQWKNTIEKVMGDYFKMLHIEDYRSHCLVLLEREKL